MKTTTNTNASLISLFTPEQLAALSPEQLAALANASVTASLETAEATEPTAAPKAPKAPEAPKAPKPEAPKAGELDPDTWVSYRTADGAPHMGKVKNMPKDVRDVKTHSGQGKALQRFNALKAEAPAETAPAESAPEAPAPEDPKHEAAPDLDGRAARIDARNQAIIATIPQARRALVVNKLKQAHEAGYRYARLARNKEHQLDGLHMYPGEKGHGRDEAFKALVTKAGQKHRDKADAAAEAGKARPKHPTRVWFWSPRGGGNLYIRGIFGDVSDA